MARTSTRVLFLSPCQPRAVGTGWEQRAFSFVRAYARVGEVEVHHAGSGDGDGVFEHDALFSTPNSLGLWMRRGFELSPGRESVAVRQLLDRSPLSYSRRSLSELEARMRARAKDCQLVHVFHYAAALIPGLWDLPIPVIWDLDEVPSDFRAAAQAVGDPRTRLRHWMRRREFDTQLARADRVLVSSSVERELLREHGNVRVVANTVQQPPSRIERAPEPGRLLFVGNFDHRANRDGLEWFFARVWPRVRELAPMARLTLVGRRPSDGWRPKAEGPIEVHFDAPELASFYARAELVLAPLRGGGGTKVKIVEAFAHGCPVLATTAGARGLELEVGTHLAIADEPQAFAQAVARLLGDRGTRQRLEEGGHRAFLAGHTQAAVDRAVDELLAELAPAPPETGFSQ